MPDLIITNGDSAGYGLRDAGKAGVILPWRDVLHEGPLVAGALEACSAERMRYLAGRFRMPADEVATSFVERDAVMRRHGDFDRIELWFEHDLYDQLQLMQVLDFFAAENRTDGVFLVQADDFLGAQRPDTILRFLERQRAIDDADLQTAAAVWRELTAATPEPVAARALRAGARFQFLAPALRRFLEELPSPANGLGRSEMAALAGIASGVASPRLLFHHAFQQEEAAFMGDSSFFHLLDDLATCEVPLIAGIAPPGPPDTEADRLEEAHLELTMAGDDVLAGEADHVAMSGLDRWWGGTHLLGSAVWRYDRERQSLVAP